MRWILTLFDNNMSPTHGTLFWLKRRVGVVKWGEFKYVGHLEWSQKHFWSLQGLFSFSPSKPNNKIENLVFALVPAENRPKMDQETCITISWFHHVILGQLGITFVELELNNQCFTFLLVTLLSKMKISVLIVCWCTTSLKPSFDSCSKSSHLSSRDVAVSYFYCRCPFHKLQSG